MAMESLAPRLQRFEAIRRDAGAPAEVFRLLTEGRTLREIAVEDFNCAAGVFTRWFMEEHREELDKAERVLGIEVAQLIRRMTDGATNETLRLLKFKTDRYLRLAGLLNPERYSPRTEIAHSGMAPTLVIEVVTEAGGERVVAELSRIESRNSEMI